MPLSQDRLNRVVQAKKKELDGWAEGVSLERDSGQSVTDLVTLGAAERWRLAGDFGRTADLLMRSRPRRYRSAISRYYYCMYQAMRAAVYLAHGGDDHQEHSVLPGHVPNDFPEQEEWQTRLKDARFARNAADYEPFPKSAKDWASRADTMQRDANALLRSTRDYLRGKGCAV